MNELDRKMAKLIELQKTKNRVRWLAIGAILSLAVTISAGIKTVYDYEHLNPEDLDDALLALKCSEYGEYVNYMQDKYCEDLTNGKIDVVEYSHLCEHLNSEEGIVEWAKTLNDEKVDEAIEIYNMAKKKRLQTTLGNVGMLALGVGALGATGYGYLEAKYKYDKDNSSFEKKYKDGGYIPR